MPSGNGLGPSAFAPASPWLQLLDDGDSEGQGRNWSSIIGIVTSIIGNILISFALNAQRYAHIRIEREHNGRRSSSGNIVSRDDLTPKDYGTDQKRIAEERAKLNAEASRPGQQIADEERNVDENTRLLNGDTDDHETPEKDENEENGRKSYLSSPYWWLGMVLMVVGEAGNFLAYGFAPASIVSPLGVVGLISNCLIAPLLLKEHFRSRDFWGVVVAIGGAITVVLSAKQDEPKLGPGSLWKHYIRRWEFLLYVVLTCVAILALAWASPRYGRRSIFIDLGLVGLFGGYTALSTKGVASLLSGSLWRVFEYPITYVLVLILVGSAVLQIRYLNKALQNFTSTQVIPVQFVLFTLSVILGSAVLYREFESTSTERAIKFIAGCLLTFLGVYLITSGRSNLDDEEEDEGEEHEEETIQLIDEEQQDVDGHASPTPKGRKASSKEEIDDPPPVAGFDITKQTSTSSIEVPSIAVTPTETSQDINRNPWLSSTDHLAGSAIASPRTPVRRLPSAPEGTPFYTPPSVPVGYYTNHSRPHLVTRAPSSPANPQTPSRASRAPSPPKADIERIPDTPSTAMLRSMRGSITDRFLPGPLLAPLNSSLSALVADSLLKGEGIPRSNRGNLRRSRSTRARFGPEDGMPEADITRQTTHQGVPQSAIEPRSVESAGHAQARLRAMSETLSGIMSRKSKNKERDVEQFVDSPAGYGPGTDPE